MLTLRGKTATINQELLCRVFVNYVNHLRQGLANEANDNKTDAIFPSLSCYVNIIVCQKVSISSTTLRIKKKKGEKCKISKYLVSLFQQLVSTEGDKISDLLMSIKLNELLV
jgi:hypothetical protein